MTPDSFSDGGEYLDPDEAVEHGLALVAAGAEVVDVGGESTRPGAEPVLGEEELRRVLPVVHELAATGVVVSIDTHKPDVAERALEAGAAVVNDVTGFTNPTMVRLVAEADCAVVVMHGREDPLDQMPADTDPVREVGQFLEHKTAEMEDAGVVGERIVVDPGIGFAKSTAQSLALLAGLGRLVEMGYPVMIGTSRKSFLATLTGAGGWDSRDNATAATTALAFDRGARLFRVHDVVKSRDALSIAAAIVAPH